MWLVPAAAIASGDWEHDFRPLPAAEWNYARAAHLLERAGFGGTPEEVAALAALPHRTAVRRIVRYQEQPGELPAFQAAGVFPSEDFAPPTGPDDVRRALVRGFFTGRAFGTKLRGGEATWIQSGLNQLFYLRFANALEGTRVAAWQAERMLVTRRPLEEKLALFWHGHFASENDVVRDYRKLMRQFELFRARGNGPFRELLLAVCRDPAMLIYLDGARNVKGRPNENFAREILELFALGPGHYTEADIRAAARAFTGWGLDGNEFAFSRRKHDRGRKTFLGRTGRLDGEDVVDAIVAHPASSHFIAGKLYRYFVSEQLPDDAHARLATLLRGHDLHVGALLETLFLSRDFYSPHAVGSQIKSPVHLVVSTYRKLGLRELPGAPHFHQTTRGLGQALLAPPNVAGWPGGRAWINPATALERQNFARYVLFPAEIPPPRAHPMAFVAGIIGVPAFEQLTAMARRGDYVSSPVIQADGPGFARAPNVAGERYNAFRAMFNGAAAALRRVPPGPFEPAELNLTALLADAGVRDAGGAVDHFARRFLRVPLRPGDRADLVAFLRGRLGGDALDPSRAQLETDLRELLHLILSLPEYQLA